MTTNNAEALRAVVSEAMRDAIDEYMLGRGISHCIDRVTAALASQPQAAGAGGDAVLVPRRMTDAMREAATAYDDVDDAWDAVLAATPAPAVEREARIAALQEREEVLKDYVADYEMLGETEDGRDAVYTPTERERLLIEDAIRGWDALDLPTSPAEAREEGCPICNGDCAGASVQPLYCPNITPPAEAREPVGDAVPVPREPTQGMIEAADRADEAMGETLCFATIYRAMIAAAPAPAVEAVNGMRCTDCGTTGTVFFMCQACSHGNYPPTEAREPEPRGAVDADMHVPTAPAHELQVDAALLRADFPLTAKHRANMAARLDRIAATLAKPPEAAHQAQGAAVDAWQPIETVPKDGKLLWLGAPHELRVGFWHQSEHRWIDFHTAESGAAVRGLRFEPTHWQRVPTPPITRPDTSADEGESPAEGDAS